MRRLNQLLANINAQSIYEDTDGKLCIFIPHAQMHELDLQYTSEPSHFNPNDIWHISEHEALRFVSTSKREAVAG